MSRKSPKSKARRWGERLILALVGGMALWALRDVDLRPLASRLGPSDWGLISVLFVTSTGLAIVPSWLFLRQAGFSLSLGGFSAIMLASNALNSTNPLRMGFPFRVYLLKDRFEIPIGTASLLIPIEGFMALFVAACAAIFVGPLHLTPTQGPWGVVIISGAVALLMISLVLGRLAAQRRLPIPSRLSAQVERVIESLRAGLAHVTPLSLLAFAVFFLASNVAVAGILWIATRASGFEVSLLFLLSAYCASHVFGTVSLMPQGLGTRDAALGILLHAGGATPEQATFAAIVVRVATTGLAFVAGLIAVSVMGLSGSARQCAVSDTSQGACSPSTENPLPGGREGIQVRR